MSAEILTITPTSGDAPEIYFGEHFIHTLWVEFIDNDYEKWYGCFPSDYPIAFNKVLVDEENKSALIVVGGIGYLIDINNHCCPTKLFTYSFNSNTGKGCKRFL